MEETTAPGSIPFGVHIPFVEHLGMLLRRFENGASEIFFDPRPEHLNSFGVAHGGALMTLMDVTLASAARSVATDSGIVTIEMKTSFMRPASGALTARGVLLHRTASLAFTEGTVHDAEGRLCCKANGTFKYMRRLATSPTTVSALRSAVAEGRIATD